MKKPYGDVIGFKDIGWMPVKRNGIKKMVSKPKWRCTKQKKTPRELDQEIWHQEDKKTMLIGKEEISSGEK